MITDYDYVALIFKATIPTRTLDHMFLIIILMILMYHSAITDELASSDQRYMSVCKRGFTKCDKSLYLFLSSKKLIFN